MYDSILGLHSYWAFATLALLLLAALNALMGTSAKRAFTAKDRKISLIALIFSHIQLLLGIILLFVSPKMEAAKGLGMGGVMKNADLRLFIVEHPLTNLIALTLITIGWSRHKKLAEDSAKFKSIGVMYLLGLILLLIRIPWNQWFSNL
jgi:hypothetical protein